MITSVQNERVKQWRKLHKKKERQKEHAFLIEGKHLIEEAQKSGWHIKEVIVDEQYEVPTSIVDEKIFTVTSHVFQSIAQTETPQGIAALVDMKTIERVPQEEELVLLVDGVQDPGNLGTMIRTADAVGCSKVILGDGTVDPYNDKVVRATQGSLFHVPLAQMNLEEAIDQLKKEHFTIWASALERARNFYDVTRTQKMALIVGNEGTGIAPSLLKKADERVTIPIYGKAESLNVSIATGILLYGMRK
ncbi:MAG TPA: RNA methyltransferase [Pseudogracilibacillus sp.]|nr:RNA methyltransferase [Pseudogracilibacillus sp.]